MKSTLTLQVVDSISALDALRPHLAALADACNAGVFDRPGFFLPWARAATLGGQEPACLCLKRGQELVGFFPLFFRRDRKALLARRGGLPTYGSSPAFDLLLAPNENEAEAARLLAQALQHSRWLDLTFANLPAHSRLERCLRQALEGREDHCARQPGQSYLMVEGPRSGEEYLAQMKSKHRGHWRRKERRLREICTIEHVTWRDDVSAALPWVRAIIENSWKFDARMRATGLQLYEAQVKGAAADQSLGLWIARLDDRPVAFSMELVDRDRGHHGYYSAYDATYSKLGPGGPLAFIAIRSCFENGGRRFDTWGNRGYLLQLATQTRETTTLTFTRTGVLPRLCLAAAQRLRGLRHSLTIKKIPPRA
jgi:hypothetical protein